MNWMGVLPWQVWVLLSGVLTAVAQVIGKRQVHRITAAQLGVVKDLSGFGVALGVWLVWGTGWEGWPMLIAIGNGAMVAVGIALYYKAVRGSLSGTSVFGYLMSQVMLVAMSAVVFSEWVYFDPRTWRGVGNLAVLLATVGAMIVYIKSLKLGRKWSGILLASALINVAGNLVAKYFVTGRMQVWNYFWAEDLGLVLGSLAILKLRRQSLRIGWENVRVGAVQGLVDILGPMIYLQILAVQPLSLASLVRRMTAIGVTSGMGICYYKEGKQMGRRAWVSLVLAAAAFVMVMWVNR